MDLNFNDLIDILDGEEFDERPVDLRTFVTSPEYLGLPPLSEYQYTLIEKSRYVREKSKIPITVSFDGGIQKYSGLLDIALEGNFVAKPSNGWYAKVDRETGEIMDKVRFGDTQTKEFWSDILTNESFKEYVRKRYEITYSSILGDDVESPEFQPDEAA